MLFWQHVLLEARKGDLDQIVHARYSLVDPKLKCVCFACGFPERTEIAHILPHAKGGTEEVRNLHVLCHPCHWESEHLSGEAYWRWFVRKEFRSACDRFINRLCDAMTVQSLAEAAARMERLVAEHNGDRVSAVQEAFCVSALPASLEAKLRSGVFG